MGKFYLVQRGTFNKEGTSFTGADGVVNLDYMGSAEFEWGAIPKAFRRIMHNFTEYEIFHTGIHTQESDELVVFCRKDCAGDVVQAIREFTSEPYRLKEYSELEKVPKVKKKDTSYTGRHSDFWWCIDLRSRYGDWMAFLTPQLDLFTRAMKNDYNDWWMKKTAEQREEEYKQSLRW